MLEVSIFLDKIGFMRKGGKVYPRKYHYHFIAFHLIFLTSSWDGTTRRIVFWS